MISLPCASKTGVTMVKSGKCVPPYASPTRHVSYYPHPKLLENTEENIRDCDHLPGELERMTSPSLSLPAQFLIWDFTAKAILPIMAGT